MDQNSAPHSFYIPVMGSGFTIDTPVLVAKYGISSVVSLLDDHLIEEMRKYWCEQYGEPYTEIATSVEDARALRITAYLNLLHHLIERQMAVLRAEPFSEDSDLNRYFELLPEGHPLQQRYRKMQAETDPLLRDQEQQFLRQAIVSGCIDVNIMTKLDAENRRHGVTLPREFSDASAALRGYAQSELDSTLVLSAGFNPHLYGYLAQFADFFPDAQGYIKKRVCIKVSDYRSAIIQGKYLAKRGIWVSEYRIESALNCGGHAFINDGQLMGPILEEFRTKRTELIANLHQVYQVALRNLKGITLQEPPVVKVTAQGGVGLHQEHDFLLRRYELNGVGWGSPFLLVPEATNVDEHNLQKLLHAQEGDVYLSKSSPIGIPFWNLRDSASEQARVRRIAEGHPGSFCTKGYTRLNQEFTTHAICTASREYQRLKLQALAQSELPPEQQELLKERVLLKSCICHDLGGGVLCKLGITHKVSPAICPGPNIVNFKRIATLKEMVNHIYGRCSLFVNKERPHLFIRELQLQVANLVEELCDASRGIPARSQSKLAEVKQNLREGIEYYRELAQELFKEQRDAFLAALSELGREIDEINLAAADLSSSS